MTIVNVMSTARYELLKCSNCGKTLGYIFIDVKIFPPKSWTRLVAGGPLVKTEKEVLCTECFSNYNKEQTTKFHEHYKLHN